MGASAAHGRQRSDPQHRGGHAGEAHRLEQRLVAGEEQHLRDRGDLGQRPQGGRRAALVEVDQHVVEHHRERLRGRAVALDVGEAQGEPHLLARAGREALGLELLAVPALDDDPLLAERAHDAQVATAGHGLEQGRRAEQQGGLVVALETTDRAVEQAMRADSFEALLRASFYHPAMQIYLDNNQSTAGNSMLARQAAQRGKQLGINENLARELLELHTLGVDGGYTQKDVQELARIITGAGVYAPQMEEKNLARAGATRAGLFLFDPRRHDFGEKTLLGSRFPAGQGMAEVDSALHLLATHPATARHLAFKLAQRFLDDEPPREIVDAMASALRASGGKISATLAPLIDSPAFAAALARPAKFKEPVDYVLSVARAACGDQAVGNRTVLAANALDMGQAPLMRSTADGYGAREADWLSPAAMAKRVRLAIGVAGERVPLARGDDERIAGARRMLALAENERPALSRGAPCAINMDWLESVVEPLSPATRASVARLAAREKAAALLASPEFMRH